METAILVHLISTNNQHVDPTLVEDYAERLTAGGYLPPIVVRRTPAGFVVVNGRHRLAAHKLLGRTTIRARISR